MKDLIRRLERLNYSIHSNGYKDSCITEAICELKKISNVKTEVRNYKAL